MIKVTITDDVETKIFFAASVEFKNYVEDRSYSLINLYDRGCKKTNTLLLECGDYVFVEEVEK